MYNEITLLLIKSVIGNFYYLKKKNFFKMKKLIKIFNT